MNRFFVTVTFFLFAFVIYAQDEGVRIILKASIGSVKNSSFHVYEPPFKAMAIYQDTLQAVNKYPEQLMSSVMSENSEAWYYYNTMENEAPSDNVKQRLNSALNMNNESNYFELLHKFQFSTNGIEYAILKFRLITDKKNKPTVGAYTLIKNNDKWKRTSTPQTFKMTLMHVFFKTDRLQEVFRGKKIGEVLMDNLIDEVYENGVLNLERLYTEFEGWSTNNEMANLKYFTKQPNWN